MPSNVLFVHGYSETSLGTYSSFPSVLQSAMPSVKEIALAAFDSLDDGITVTDLADAMEARVGYLESTKRWDVSDTGVICHSTGAIVARRWILNRLAAGKTLPSHLITLAGANHGSSLAHMGKSVLGYLQKLLFDRELSVGQGVLTDLEYGSDFLLDLNLEWLDAWNAGTLGDLFVFSAGGDTPGSSPALQVFWQTHESGSDNTVRISGANLNYTIITATYDENGQTVTAAYPLRRVPHRIVPGYSHFGASGIIAAVTKPSDPPMQTVVEALSVTTAADYAACERRWTAELQQWIDAHPDDANATAIFTIVDRNGAAIDDCIIAFLEQAPLGGDAAGLTAAGNGQARALAMNNCSPCVLPHSPIQNDAQTGSYSFYLNFKKYLDSSPHWIHIQTDAASLLGRRDYPYPAMTFTPPPILAHTISPNECTYVHLTIGRKSDASYGIYAFDPAMNLESVHFPPFPPGGRIAP